MPYVIRYVAPDPNTVSTGFLAEYKTYGVVLTALGYLAFQKFVMGQPPDTNIMLGLGALLAAALRSAMKTSDAKVAMAIKSLREPAEKPLA